MPKTKFEGAVSRIRATPSGEERTMYPSIRDLIVDSLGYARGHVQTELSGAEGRPDLTVQARSGFKQADGSDELVPWIVVEAKDERGVFLDEPKRRRILAEKSKYVGPTTAWLLLVDPAVVMALPVNVALPAETAAITFLLDDTATEEEFRSRFAPLGATQADVTLLLRRFREGDETLIACTSLADPGPAEGPEHETALVARRHFYEALHEITNVLQGATRLAFADVLGEVTDLKSRADEFKGKYRSCQVTIDPFSVRGAPEGPVESRAHSRDATVLRRTLSEKAAAARLAFRDLDAFQARTGASTEHLNELFAIETANLLLARILLIRFFEDHGFFKEKRYICNGGLTAFRGMMEYFDVGHAQLLERAYREAGHFYAAAFDRTELDWVFDRNNELLNRTIEWAMFQLSRYDFRTVKGDILTGIYDRFLKPEQRKRLGEYFTPPSIARYIVDRVGVQPGQRLMDPACGSGTFLIEAYQSLVGEAADRGLKAYEDALEVVAGLKGNDLNAFSAVLTKIQLLWHLLQFRGHVLEEGFPDLDVAEKYNALAVPTLELHASRFAELDQPIFDAVVGNPPYVRKERLSEILDRETKAWYEREIKAGVNLYALFIYRALSSWCREAGDDGRAGRLGFVIPLSFCGVEENRDLRALFGPSGKWKILEIVDLEQIWQQVFDAKILPMLFIAERARPGSEDLVVLKCADESCVSSPPLGGRAVFRFEGLAEHRIPYLRLFTPDGRIMTRITESSLRLVERIRANQTFEEVARCYWVRFQGARLVEAALERAGNPGERWEARRMLREGVAFRGGRESAGQGGGIDVYKGENIAALELQGAPQATGVDLSKADDPSLWRFPAILPTKGFAFPQICACPVAVAFNPATVAFTNTVSLFFPDDRLADFPFDLLILSRIYRFYYVIALRMSYLDDQRSHLYGTNLGMLPWNDLLVGSQGGLEGLRGPLLQASRRVFQSLEALQADYESVPRRTFAEGCESTPGTVVVWSESMNRPGYQCTAAASLVEEGGSWKVLLGGGGADWLRVNDRQVARQLALGLQVVEGEAVGKREVLRLLVPRDEAAMERVDKMLRERSPADDRAGLELILDQIDEIVAAGLGLDETELEEIQRLCREDGFLKAIQPRYPFAEVRRQGFRKNLDKSTRYQ